MHANAVVFVDGARGATVAQEDTDGTPTALAAGAGALWATDSAHDRVLRLDPSGHRTIDRIQVERSPSAIVATSEGVWVANTGSGTLSEISPGSGTVVATVRVGDAPVAVAAGGGAIWVADANDGTVRRIDPRRAVVAATIQLGQSLTDIAASDDAVWVTSASAGLLIRLDIRANRPVRTSAVGNGPGAIALAGGAVWVANPPDDTVSRVDPETGAVRKLNVAAPGALVASDGALWVARTQALDLVEIDLATRSLGRTIPTGSPVASLASYEGGLALATRAPPASHLGGTLRVVAGDDLDSLDPGRSWSSPGWHLLSLTNDGLVTYARIPGPGGGTVVPDLAVALPVAQDGGRTYTFQLRRGVRYSTGAPIRPADFRATFERQYRAEYRPCRVRRPDPRRGPLLARPLRPLERDRGGRCDADDHVPPEQARSGLPLQARAAVRIRGSRRLTSGRHRRAAAARDRRVPDPALSPRPRGRARAQPVLPAVVGRGAADGVPRPHHAAPRRRPRPPGRCDLGRHGGRDARQAARPVRSHGSAAACPCSSTRSRCRSSWACSSTCASRRSIALRFAARSRSPSTARPSSSFPGDRPWRGPPARSCRPAFPATSRSVPTPRGRTRQASGRHRTVARARSLIAGSGTAGMRVVVATIRNDPVKRALGRYFAGLLNDLGYRASMRLHRDHHAYYTAVRHGSERARRSASWAGMPTIRRPRASSSRC